MNKRAVDATRLMYLILIILIIAGFALFVSKLRAMQ
jgi:uncharacterized membrane protein YqhA